MGARHSVSSVRESGGTKANEGAKESISRFMHDDHIVPLHGSFLENPDRFGVRTSIQGPLSLSQDACMNFSKEDA